MRCASDQSTVVLLPLSFEGSLRCTEAAVAGLVLLLLLVLLLKSGLGRIGLHSHGSNTELSYRRLSCSRLIVAALTVKWECERGLDGSSAVPGWSRR